MNNNYQSLIQSNKSNIHYNIALNIYEAFDHYYYKKIVEKNNRPLKELFFHYDKFLWKPEFFNYLIFYNIYCLSYYLSSSHINKFLSISHLNIFYILYLLENIQTDKYGYKPFYDKNLLQNIAFSLFQYIIFMKLKLNQNNNNNYNFYKLLYQSSIFSFQSLIKINETYIKRIENIIKEKESIKSKKSSIVSDISNLSNLTNNKLKDYINNKNNKELNYYFNKKENINNENNDDINNHLNIDNNDNFDDLINKFPENLLVFTSDIKLIKQIIVFTRHFTFSNFIFFLSFLILFL